MSSNKLLFNDNILTLYIYLPYFYACSYALVLFCVKAAIIYICEMQYIIYIIYICEMQGLFAIFVFNMFIS